MSIIDVETRQVVETLDLDMLDANRLKFTPDGRVLIIDGEAASLVVMDAESRQVIRRISVGATDTGDGAVLVSPDGTRAYLGLRAADRVAVVDLETLEVSSENPDGERGWTRAVSTGSAPASSGLARRSPRPRVRPEERDDAGGGLTRIDVGTTVDPRLDRRRRPGAVDRAAGPAPHRLTLDAVHLNGNLDGGTLVREAHDLVPLPPPRGRPAPAAPVAPDGRRRAATGAKAANTRDRSAQSR